MSPILFAFGGLSGTELILILAAVLILFGAKKIPEFAKGLGQGMKEFKKATREVQDELERAVDDSHTPPPPPPAAQEPRQPEAIAPAEAAAPSSGQAKS